MSLSKPFRCLSGSLAAPTASGVLLAPCTRCAHSPALWRWAMPAATCGSTSSPSRRSRCGWCPHARHYTRAQGHVLARCCALPRVPGHSVTGSSACPAAAGAPHEHRRDAHPLRECGAAGRRSRTLGIVPTSLEAWSNRPHIPSLFTQSLLALLCSRAASSTFCATRATPPTCLRWRWPPSSSWRRWRTRRATCPCWTCCRCARLLGSRAASVSFLANLGPAGPAAGVWARRAGLEGLPLVCGAWQARHGRLHAGLQPPMSSSFVMDTGCWPPAAARALPTATSACCSPPSCSARAPWSSRWRPWPLAAT